MTSQFDSTPDRTNTYAFKYEKYKGKDIIPTWVADTEFACAPAILDAIKTRVDHGILGYYLPAQYAPANQAIVEWLDTQHDWQIQADWIVWVPGVVPGFNAVCKGFCEAGDKVIVQTPNYPPLLAAPQLNGLTKVEVGTVEVEGRLTIDFDALETAASDPQCKLFIVCNPMNPVGTVFTQEELDRVADICLRHDVLLCSDEIHCDLVLEPGIKHLPAGRHAALADKSITLMAASKTFNVAGLGAAFAIIPDKKTRLSFSQAMAGLVPWVNILGLVATEAAFTEAKEWHREELEYLRGNRDYLVDAINQIPGLKALSPDATFLLWVDASGLGQENVQSWCESKGVGPSPGVDFGAPDCFRINYGCSRATLEAIVARLASE